MIIADMGAKVEHPHGDHVLPLFGEAYYAEANRNKRRISIGVKHPQPKVVVRKLFERTDVSLED